MFALMAQLRECCAENVSCIRMRVRRTSFRERGDTSGGVFVYSCYRLLLLHSLSSGCLCCSSCAGVSITSGLVVHKRKRETQAMRHFIMHTRHNTLDFEMCLTKIMLHCLSLGMQGVCRFHGFYYFHTSTTSVHQYHKKIQ